MKWKKIGLRHHHDMLVNQDPAAILDDIMDGSMVGIEENP